MFSNVGLRNILPVVPSTVAPDADLVEKQKPKRMPKRVSYKKKEYYYILKETNEGIPESYILFDKSDPELKNPIGYLLADPVSKLPKGDLLPPPSK